MIVHLLWARPPQMRDVRVTPASLALQAATIRDLQDEVEAAEARAARLEESLAAGFAERSAMAEQLAAVDAARMTAATEKDRVADQLSQVQRLGKTAVMPNTAGD